MDRKKAICEYLRQNHIGKEKAIHSKELEKLFMLDGRNIRRKISALDRMAFLFAAMRRDITTQTIRKKSTTQFAGSMSLLRRFPMPEPACCLHRFLVRRNRPLRSQSK